MIINKVGHKGASHLTHRYCHVALRCLQRSDAGPWHGPSHCWEFGVGWGVGVEDGNHTVCRLSSLLAAPIGTPESSWGPDVPGSQAYPLGSPELL